MADIYQEAAESIVSADRASAEEVAQRALDSGIAPADIMQNGFVKGIQEVGDLFESGEVFLPELMMSADAMAGATEVTNAALEGEAAEAKGVIVIGTVQGDVHDIGKAIVIAYLKANGYEVTDLGRDVSADTFIEQGQGAERRRHRHERPAHHHHGGAEEGHQARQGRGPALQDRRRRRPLHAALGRPDRRRRLRRGRQRRRQEDRRAARQVRRAGSESRGLRGAGRRPPLARSARPVARRGTMACMNEWDGGSSTTGPARRTPRAMTWTRSSPGASRGRG